MPTPEQIQADLASLDFGEETGGEEEIAGLPAKKPADKAQSENTSDTEKQAILKGWKPKADYKDDPAKWVDAKTFLERGEKFNKNLQKELDQVKRQLEQFKGTAEAFAKFSKEQLAAKQTELDNTITELRKAKLEAARNGEDDTVIKLEDRIELVQQQKKDLKALPEAVAPTGPDSQDPVLRAWVDEGNEWFDNDPKLRRYALAIGKELRDSGETLRNRAFLDKVTDLVKQDFPEAFAEKAPASSVESSRTNGSRPAGKTERDLPQEDRDLMKQYIKNGWTTKEEFLKSYFSRNN
jgi:hypothetical protein